MKVLSIKVVVPESREEAKEVVNSMVVQVKQSEVYHAAKQASVAFLNSASCLLRDLASKLEAKSK